ncbi:related to Glucoamylase [Ramularia collo-cygni]|uniref:glucan 1,4-alpha-glucosidase n=1 Tax=Ramularia collo-cygni TaxID=112498 RepID=A0A2D3VG45_9PEZI|nr:related to Glucoamylase [Ramularia collo-cygni]CZT20839.1 related to Glucoamylase [Ramularia collo-cygni]
MRQVNTGVAAGLVLLHGVNTQECQTTTLSSSVPTDGNVALASYSYCGGILNTTAFISNLAYNKQVTLYYTDREGESTPLSSVGLGYQSGVEGTNFELWSSSSPAYVDGVQELLNLTYVVVDLAIESGPPEPTLPGPPAPYATPKGFGDDITTFLAVEAGSQLEKSFTKMFVNINPAVEGAVDGVVIAGRSGSPFESKLPDYAYDWVRDSSLTMEVVETLYAAAASNSTAKSQYETMLFQYAAARAAEQTEPNLQTGLGEPKFYLNNTIFSGPWGRPQNDGPATAAITLIEFAQSYMAAGGNITTVKQQLYDSINFPDSAPIQKDLLFVASNWTSSSFDLWEEVNTDNFYTRMVQRKALILGAKFASDMDDTGTATTLSVAADAISATMEIFWNEGRKILLYEYGPVLLSKSSYLDAAVPLGIIHGYADDGVFSYTNDQVQSTIVRFVTSFITEYAIANNTQQDSAGLTLGIPVGRYPEDVYTGVGTEEDGGNAWYLTTAAVAQYLWATSAEYTAEGRIVVSDTSRSFFDYFAPDAALQVGTYASDTAEFASTIESLNGWGDAFMRTVKLYTPADGSLTEQYNRNTGAPQGCKDLTWSYASLLTASFQRAKLRGDAKYVENLANLGVNLNI